MTANFVLKKFTTNRLRIKANKKELLAAGRRQAEQIPVSELTTYRPVKRDVVQMLRQQESALIPELLGLRHQRMMKNAFTFFRGTAGVMEYDLLHGPLSQIPVMICGDAHLNNFGFFASPERQLLFGLNDFDETKIGNWEADLKRLLVSIDLTGRLNGLTAADNDDILKATAQAYADGINYSEGLKLMDRFYLSYNIKDLQKQWGQDKQMVKVLTKIANRAPKNNSDKVVKKFTEEVDGQLRFKENPPRARRISAKSYDELLAAFDQYRLNVASDVRVLLSNFRVSDIIRYSVGVGSFGTRCYLVLLTGKDDSHLVLQIKEALPSMYDLNTMDQEQAQQQGFEEGRRVITGQRILQTHYDPFLGATEMGQRSFYVRQFRDMKDSIDATKLDQDAFTAYSELCGFILAVAHYQSPTAPMIAGYLAASKKFPSAFSQWAQAYAEQVDQDYAAFARYLQGEE